MPAPVVVPINQTKGEDNYAANVDETHPDYVAMQTSWEKMHDVCISETHMHAQGTKYLPKLDEMTDDQYDAYVKRAEFPLFAKHTLDSFVGMSMRKDLLIGGIDSDHPFFKNCDGKGTSIKAYSEKLVRKFLQYGRCGTLIEMPSADPNMSIADAEAQNISVRFAFYDHEAIINWKVSTENNLDILTMVVLKEKVDASTNQFAHLEEYRYRVLKLVDGIYSQDIYDHDLTLIDTKVPLMNDAPMSYIPFVIHGGVEVRTPTMLPIGEQNIHWYMKDADYQHGLHYTALPTPYVIGVDPKDENRPRTIGPQRLWFLPLGATAGMLEFTGAGLGQIAKSMEDTMSNITVLSSQILVPKSAYDETATAASIRSASETASLSSMVTDLSEELTILVVNASIWGDFFVPDTSVEINSDFIPLTLSGADVSAYVSAVLKQGFSKRTLFELLKKGEIIEGNRQYEEEMAAINKEAQDRMDEEVELAARLAKIEAKLDIVTDKAMQSGDNSGGDGDGDNSDQNKDVKRKDSSQAADTANANSSRQNASE